MPSGLSQDELLAKIDSLDWDETVTQQTTVLAGEKATQYPDHSTSSWRVVAIVALIACVLTVLYFVLAPAPAVRPAADGAPTPISAVAGTQQTAGADVPAPVVAADAGAAAVAAAEERRVALYAHAIEEAEQKVQQKAEQRAEQRRKAREARDAERARIAALQERERRQKEEARLRAERDAEEAARVAAKSREAAVPKGPSSPQELCAGEGNIFSRGSCEARACSKSEWRSHPFCIRRMEQQMPGFGQGG